MRHTGAHHHLRLTRADDRRRYPSIRPNRPTPPAPDARPARNAPTPTPPQPPNPRRPHRPDPPRRGSAPTSTPDPSPASHDCNISNASWVAVCTESTTPSVPELGSQTTDIVANVVGLQGHWRPRDIYSTAATRGGRHCGRQCLRRDGTDHQLAHGQNRQARCRRPSPPTPPRCRPARSGPEPATRPAACRQTPCQENGSIVASPAVGDPPARAAPRPTPPDESRSLPTFTPSPDGHLGEDLGPTPPQRPQTAETPDRTRSRGGQPLIGVGHIDRRRPDRRPHRQIRAPSRATRAQHTLRVQHPLRIRTAATRIHRHARRPTRPRRRRRPAPGRRRPPATPAATTTSAPPPPSSRPHHRPATPTRRIPRRETTPPRPRRDRPTRAEGHGQPARQHHPTRIGPLHHRAQQADDRPAPSPHHADRRPDRPTGQPKPLPHKSIRRQIDLPAARECRPPVHARRPQRAPAPPTAGPVRPAVVAAQRGNRRNRGTPRSARRPGSPPPRRSAPAAGWTSTKTRYPASRRAAHRRLRSAPAAGCFGTSTRRSMTCGSASSPVTLDNNSTATTRPMAASARENSSSIGVDQRRVGGMSTPIQRARTRRPRSAIASSSQGAHLAGNDHRVGPR